MTNNALAMRDDRSIDLSVFQVNGGGDYIVGSSKGKILYNVHANNGSKSCTCADYITNIKNDPNFMCKHILAAVKTNGNSIPVNPLKIWKPKLDDRFITKYKGKDFVLYTGLLDLAHQKGLSKLIVEIMQYPIKDNGNEAICRAILESYNGERFIEIGDANPRNVGEFIKPHIIRMAATRAKARTLRDFTNIGMTCLEELAEVEDNIKNALDKAEKTAKPKVEKPVAKPKADKPKTEEKQANPANGKRPTLSMAQKNAIVKLASRRSITEDQLENKAVEIFGCAVESLTPEDASSFIRELQKSA